MSPVLLCRKSDWLVEPFPRLNQAPDTEPRHYAFVDALRGIAFLMVLVMHAGGNTPGLPDRVHELTNKGAYGVQLFFLASAFTLFTSLSQRSRREARPAVTFLIRRFFRIAPLFWAAGIFYLFYYSGHPGEAVSPFGISYRDILLTTVFLHGWTPTSINSVVPGGWSIAVEMNFYLLVPLLFRWINSFRRAIWFLAFTLIFSPIADFAGRCWFEVFPAPAHLRDQFLAYWLPAQLSVFALGFILFFILDPKLAGHRARAACKKTGKCTWGLLAVLAAAICSRLPGVRGAAGLVFFGLALALASYPIRLLVNRVTRYVGELSYSAYLVHFAVLDGCVKLLNAIPAISHHPLFYLVLLVLAGAAGTIVVSICTYRFIERPGREIGRRLIARPERMILRPRAAAFPVYSEGLTD